METTTLSAGDFDAIAHHLHLRPAQVRATTELLDEGNTVPFITRYRKDLTGGLDEEQIRAIHEAVSLHRQITERREKVLRSIESQGKLTDSLRAEIEAAQTLKALDDLYLPFRPKKQTLATIAKQRGLEPLALQILAADPAVADLAASCQGFIQPENGLSSVADVLTGVRHLLAEAFSEQTDLRALARNILTDGVLVSKRIERSADDADSEHDEHDEHDEPSLDDSSAEDEAEASSRPEPAEAVSESQPSDVDASEPSPAADVTPSPPAEDESAEQAAPIAEESATAEVPTDSVPTSEGAAVEGEPPAAEIAASSDQAVPATVVSPAKPAKPVKPKLSLAEQRRRQRRESRHQKRHKLEQSFKDYFDYSEPLRKMPDYRTLAINRGERCKVLRVRIQHDSDRLKQAAEAAAVPPDHPHADLLREALLDALNRLLVPSIEREIRRDKGEQAELHAVRVFAQNLKKLLLQAPLCNHRVLAVDPGFRSGCKLAVLDEFGNLLEHALIHVIGAADRVQQSRQRLVELIRKHRISVIAIGNGTASRETEQFIAQILAEDLADEQVNYLVVNEAGASVYSTSQIGREELPKLDATVRGAVSIGRRVLDPLSELVKIDPANIGVGLYQHDIKAKHLRSSLDAVVESCVNYVGVDVNSASPALLSYVSGLNQLTARRIYEYRQKNGPFKNREELKKVAGVGEATYVQAAGFLKVANGDNPLDATWIHPESYEAALSVLNELGCDLGELNLPARPVRVPPIQVHVARAPEGASATSEAEHAADVATEVSSEAPAENVTEGASPPEVTATEAAAVEPAAVEPAAVEEPVTSTEPEQGGAAAPKKSPLTDRLKEVAVEQLAEKLSIGPLLLRDILGGLARPGRDPREDLSPPLFRREILKLEDLRPGMELSGTVLNVVDFGAFVDIGLTDSGLIHVSRLADRFVSDPHDVVSVGDVINVWVVDVDEKRRRVSLTAIPPGTERPRGRRPEKPAAEQRPAQQRRKPRRDQAAGEKARGGRGGFGKGRRSHGGGQPPRPKAKSKPVVPITQAMVDGREPMRTFSDLQQFYQRRKDEPADSPSTDNSGPSDPSE